MNVSVKSTAFRAVGVAVLAIVSLNGIHALASDKNQTVIYGKDDRKDLYEVTNPLYTQLAASTVALVKTEDVSQSSSGVVKIHASTFQVLMGVCKSERFSDQPSGAFCSGTLIGKNLILTAGHCITSAEECAGVKFVFGYDVNKKGKYPTEVAEQEVVGCKSIVYRQQVNDGADFGIIETDRAITNHEPAKLAMGRTSSTIANGTPLVMIGHPAGLPTKVEDGGKVRDNSKNGFFTANTDSYGGNSGSGIFNQQTGEVEGVLVRGESDYVYKGGCYVSNVCSDTGCRGEDVTKIASVIPELPHSR